MWYDASAKCSASPSGSRGKSSIGNAALHDHELPIGRHRREELGELLDEVLGEQRNVLDPLAQRRQGDRKDIQSVVEIAAEAPLLDLGADVAPEKFIEAVREGRRARPKLPNGFPAGLARWLDVLLSPDPAEQIRILARSAGGGTHRIGTTTIETWTYDRGSQSFAMVVTIVDGKIKSMERGD